MFKRLLGYSKSRLRPTQQSKRLRQGRLGKLQTRSKTLSLPDYIELCLLKPSPQTPKPADSQNSKPRTLNPQTLYSEPEAQLRNKGAPKPHRSLIGTLKGALIVKKESTLRPWCGHGAQPQVHDRPSGTSGGLGLCLLLWYEGLGFRV